MVLDSEKAEEQLRSELYAALTELSFAGDHEKAEIVDRLHKLCGKLHQLINSRTVAEKNCSGSTIRKPTRSRRRIHRTG